MNLHFQENFPISLIKKDFRSFVKRWNTDFQLTFHLIDSPIFRCSSYFFATLSKINRFPSDITEIVCIYQFWIWCSTTIVYFVKEQFVYELRLTVRYEECYKSFQAKKYGQLKNRCIYDTKLFGGEILFILTRSKKFRVTEIKLKLESDITSKIQGLIHVCFYQVIKSISRNEDLNTYKPEFPHACSTTEMKIFWVSMSFNYMQHQIISWWFNKFYKTV